MNLYNNFSFCRIGWKLAGYGVFCAALLVSGCSKVDEFMLGKDNAPKPASLTPVTPKIKLAEKWSAPVGKPNLQDTYLKLQPVVRNKTIYTADVSGLVQAIDADTAKVLWSTQLTDKLQSGPSVAEGYLALGTDSSKIIMLRLSDGKELWQAKVSGDVLAKPAIAQGKVIVKTINGNLYSFNAATGEKQWVFDHGAPGLILKASSSPKILDKLALVGFSDGKLDAIDLQTGGIVWQRSIAYANGASDVERLVDIDADPVIRGKTLFLATYQGYVGALSLDNGEFIWRKPASTFKNIAIDNRSLYMTDSDDVIWAFDLQSGQVQWKQPALKARGVTEPVIMGNRLVLGDKTGYLHVLSVHNGDFIYRKELGAPVQTAPVVSNSELYVLTANGKLNHFSVS
ncbi:outer membrane protein assembly factor BamB [Legionella londiniensis]|uniref:Outer membrane protein assembly factor BamB n=1 Tax=Legionella londiniensis TaxID=45068 RepID=A0A0W0VMB1_9GAMM|nr:outer membrane protein assembly factor BamB [Legionella londiniensis]KTD21291.1 PQQ (pyrrolo quinoline) WD40-like repeat, enzyme repeat domain protein [Legionella londiniensis]STX93317.1 PQQ (pyrrolo quinoline) WD40-like repeat, enzyme repeat domain protein [Legionella londiniensis]